MVLNMVAPGENVIAKGDDVQAGNIIVFRGQKLAPQHIGVLAACGWADVVVYHKVNVAIISTGDELVGINESIKFGQIRDINSYTLGAMLSAMGCSVKPMGIVKDSFEQFFAVLSQAVSTCQLVVISGGSSVGARDYTEKAIAALGTPGVLIHGIAIKPGKPTIFGMANGVPVFGLPGHPVAAMVVCQQFVTLALSKLMGQKESAQAVTIQGHLSRNVASVPGRDDFVTVRLVKQDGQYIAHPILGKSGMISSMSEADGIIHIPTDKSGLYVGEMVEIVLNKSVEW
jgi:molybdopterin molybdotransferase